MALDSTSVASTAACIVLTYLLNLLHPFLLRLPHFLCHRFFPSLLLFLRHHPLAASLWAVAAASAAWRLLSATLLRRSRVFVVDFSCVKPHDGDAEKCNYEVSEFVTRSNADRFTLPSLNFQKKIFERSGLGEETYLPPCLFKDPPVPTFADGRAEAESVMFAAVHHLLRQTSVRPSDISVLITNCSLHCPSPSYAAMILHRFNLPEDCQSFHLAGMGCSASLIACDLAARLLRAPRRLRRRRRQYALVVSTENITLNYYFGNEKPMLVTNCLFRIGAAAVLLSSGGGGKYEFRQCVRTTAAAEDKAYGCAYQTEDEKGWQGVALSKNLMGVAAAATRSNVAVLGPAILPWTEQLQFVYTFLCREVLKMKQMKLYQPDFRLAVDHFCIHAGGRAVIDEIQRHLRLEDRHLEPSRATLHRWGNTSSSSLWYVLSYMECQGRIKAGDMVWLLGLGSGFKCNSAIFRALSDVQGGGTANPWSDCIHRYPACLQLSSKPTTGQLSGGRLL